MEHDEHGDLNKGVFSPTLYGKKKLDLLSQWMDWDRFFFNQVPLFIALIPISDGKIPVNWLVLAPFKAQLLMLNPIRIQLWMVTLW